jgi:nitroreductase
MLPSADTPAGTVPEVHDLILRRWSPKHFREPDVPQPVLHALFEAARWAASSFNEQPWRFILARRGEPGYQRLLEVLTPRNREWASGAPVLLLTAASRSFSRNGTPNLHALHDAGMALATLALQAVSLGLAVHPMAGFDRAAAREAFHIPEDYELGAAVAIGYPAEPQPPSTRTRKPLSEFVFTGEWGRPAEL